MEQSTADGGATVSHRASKHLLGSGEVAAEGQEETCLDLAMGH